MPTDPIGSRSISGPLPDTESSTTPAAEDTPVDAPAPDRVDPRGLERGAKTRPPVHRPLDGAFIRQQGPLPHEGKTTPAYRQEGPLFVDGPSLEDVGQGPLADCWLMAAFAAQAHADPQSIERAVRRNDDGTFTVTFREPDKQGNWHDVHVQVDDELAGFADASPNNSPELWVAVLEKAYALWKGGDYKNIEGGVAARAMEALSGSYTSVYPVSSTTTANQLAETLRQELSAGRPITVVTKKTWWRNRGLADWHFYVVTGIQERDGKSYAKLYNPWGTNDGTFDPNLEIPVKDLLKRIADVQVGGGRASPLG